MFFTSDLGAFQLSFYGSKSITVDLKKALVKKYYIQF